MNKTIILTVIITTLIIGVLFAGYTFTTNEKNVIAASVVQEQVNAEPAYEYAGTSEEAQARSIKMQKINAEVEQKYPHLDNTQKKIASLCLAGNVGACSVLKEGV